MPARSNRPPRAFDVCSNKRVPIAMSIALEVVAELRARERASAERILLEIVHGPAHPSKR